MDELTEVETRSDAARRESIRALWCVGGALVIALACVAGVRATVGAGAPTAGAQLATSDGPTAQVAAEGHQHTGDDAAGSGTGHQHVDGEQHSSAAHAGTAHGHGGSGQGADHAAHEGSAHDHTAAGASDVHTVASGHTHGLTGSTASTSDGHHHDPSNAAGATSPTTGHDHSSPPPGGSTTPTTAHQHTPATSAPVQLDDLPPDIKAQIIAVRDWALHFPTTQDAIDSGYPQATIFFHGIAAHYLNYSLLDDVFDPAEPEALLYNADGQLVGVNYIVYSGASPPEGFPGDLDQWHEHPTLCRNPVTTLILGAEDVNEADCAAMGGRLFDFSGFYLLHVWCIPGWEAPEGIFSHENSRV